MPQDLFTSEPITWILKSVVSFGIVDFCRCYFNVLTTNDETESFNILIFFYWLWERLRIKTIVIHWLSQKYNWNLSKRARIRYFGILAYYFNDIDLKIKLSVFKYLNSNNDNIYFSPWIIRMHSNIVFSTFLASIQEERNLFTSNFTVTKFCSTYHFDMHLQFGSFDYFDVIKLLCCALTIP